jgi:hypothetical protein
MQPDARDFRRDLRNFDAVVFLEQALRHATQIGGTVGANCHKDVMPLGRLRMQGPVGARVDLPLRARLALAAALMSVGGRRARILRRLRRPAKLLAQRRILGPQSLVGRAQGCILRCQRGDALRQLGKLRQQRRDQRVLVGDRHRGWVRSRSHSIPRSDLPTLIDVNKT